MGIRILIVDDHRIMREGLTALIEKEDGLNVVGEAAHGRDAVKMAIELQPDIVLMDLLMPELNGFEAIQRIATQAEGVKIIALSMHSDNEYILKALRGGASGYLLKNCAREDLIKAIKSVHSGKLYLCKEVKDILVNNYITSSNGPKSETIVKLTPREREILQLLAEGRSTKQIASLLSISTKTVETHRSQVMNKLNLFSIAELTKHAIREGLTQL